MSMFLLLSDDAACPIADCRLKRRMNKTVYVAVWYFILAICLDSKLDFFGLLEWHGYDINDFGSSIKNLTLEND
jgi:hypothetical protein